MTVNDDFRNCTKILRSCYHVSSSTPENNLAKKRSKSVVGDLGNCYRYRRMKLNADDNFSFETRSLPRQGEKSQRQGISWGNFRVLHNQIPNMPE